MTQNAYNDSECKITDSAKLSRMQNASECKVIQNVKWQISPNANDL